MNNAAKSFDILAINFYIIIDILIVQQKYFLIKQKNKQGTLIKYKRIC